MRMFDGYSGCLSVGVKGGSLDEAYCRSVGGCKKHIDAG